MQCHKKESKLNFNSTTGERNISKSLQIILDVRNGPGTQALLSQPPPQENRFMSWDKHVTEQAMGRVTGNKVEPFH